LLLGLYTGKQRLLAETVMASRSVVGWPRTLLHLPQRSPPHPSKCVSHHKGTQRWPHPTYLCLQSLLGVFSPFSPYPGELTQDSYTAAVLRFWLEQSCSCNSHPEEWTRAVAYSPSSGQTKRKQMSVAVTCSPAASGRSVSGS
jgi:hypothetical protein